MTKSDYIHRRINNDINIVYEYYLEKFDRNRHKGNILGIQEFFIYLNMWGDINQIFERIRSHYDQKFNIIILSDKNNNILGYL